MKISAARKEKAYMSELHTQETKMGCDSLSFITACEQLQ